MGEWGKGAADKRRKVGKNTGQMVGRSKERGDRDTRRQTPKNRTELPGKRNNKRKKNGRMPRWMGIPSTMGKHNKRGPHMGNTRDTNKNQGHRSK